MSLDEEKYPRIIGVNYESFVDGRGVRAAIFLSGCSHHCPGCHNPDSHDPEAGNVVTDETLEEILCQINKRKRFLDGITLTGGDPLYCPAKTLNLVQVLTTDERW